MLEHSKFRLPEFDYSQYDLILKALQYYINCSFEFSVDMEIYHETYQLKRMLQEKAFVRNLETSKFRLPELNYNQYDLLLKALQYYRNCSVEFSIDGDILNDVYIAITIIQEKTNM